MKTGFPSRLRGVILLLRLVAMSAAHGVSQDFSAWSHHAVFRMNTGPSGAALTRDIADFPLLLRLDPANFNFAQAKADGSDIRFSGPGGIPLAYEIERWDAALRKAEVWIRMPLIKAGTDTGGFRMHWGNPAALPASDGKAVFDTAGGFKGVWHLYGGAVRDAAGASDDGDASLSARADGLIAGARSLQGSDSGMLVPEGPALRPGSALTFSLWINADTWAGRDHRILQKGDSGFEFALYQERDSLVWAVGADSGAAPVKAPLPDSGTWRHIAGTYDGTTSRLFLDGREAAARAVTGAIRPAAGHLGLGCRMNRKKPLDSFEGRLDEAAYAGRARSADWIRLAFLTQSAQAMVVLPPVPVPLDTVPVDSVPKDSLPACADKFSLPQDTTVSEGEMLVLRGTADCATAYTWTAVSGPVPRLLDPDVKVLALQAPRIDRDAALVFRFTASFGAVQRTGDVRVTVREAIPDPLFDLPALAAWNGRDPLTLRPTLLNQAAIAASRAPKIRYAWSLARVEADTTVEREALILKKAHASGSLDVSLCLDNGGTPQCRTLTIRVDLPARILPPGAAPGPGNRPRPAWDAAGRRIPARKSIENGEFRGIIRGLPSLGGYRGQEMASRPEGDHPPGE